MLSLDHLDCASCGDRLAARLREQLGVFRVGFDKRSAEMTIVAAPSFDPFPAAKKLAQGETFEILPGAGRGHYIPWDHTKSAEGADVRAVNLDGSDVPDLASVLAAGKVTVVDFSAIWCEPCRALDAHMMQTVAEHDDVAYRKLDVGDWDTPIAKHYLGGIPSLPYVIVFDKGGRKVDTIAGLDLVKLDRAIASSRAKR